MHWRAADRPLQVLQSAPDVAVSPFLSHLSVCFIFCVSREDGIGELYTYLPQTERNTDQLLLIPPKSIQHPDYGFSVGRGAFTFTPGRWTRVTQRVKMNALGKEDGILLLPSLPSISLNVPFVMSSCESSSCIVRAARSISKC